MSDWNGPGLYRIESTKKRSCRVSLSGGRKEDGTKIVTWNDDTNKNDVFAITYAGIGKTGKHEYHIINNNSGTYMASPDKAPQVVPLTGEVLSPSNDRTRWSIIPVRDGSGKYWIAPVANSKMFLNIRGASYDSGVELILYPGAKHDNSMWYLRLFDDAFLNCPKITKAD